MTAPLDQNPTTPSAAATLAAPTVVSEAALIAMGMAYLNRGARNIEAARETAKVLRVEYKKSRQTPPQRQADSLGSGIIIDGILRLRRRRALHGL